MNQKHLLNYNSLSKKYYEMIWDAFYLHGRPRQKVTTQDNNPGIIWDHQQLKTTSLTALFFYKVFIFVYFWTGTVMLGSLACVPVNYVHRQPALFLHKVILTIYFSDISRCIKSLKIFQDIFFRNFKILYINGSVNYVHRQPASFCTE